MNILQVISGRGVNGALVYCKYLSEELVSRGHQVTILCKPNSWIKTHVDQTNVEVIESNLARFPFAEFKRIASVIRDKNIDLIHTHMTRGQNFGIGLKFITGKPVVATAHNRHFELHWNFNDFVIANSKSTFNFHRRVNLVPASRMQTIYCCSDPDHQRPVSPSAALAIRQKLRLKPDSILVGIVGEVAARKGHKYLVQALPKIISKIPNVKVIFVGRYGRKQPYFRQMRKFLFDNKLFGVVKWLGRRSNVQEYLSACDLSVMPSIEEPLGLVAIESLMAGTPVVASQTGGLTEIVNTGENGVLVPPRDPETLADAIIHLAQHRELRRTMGESGQRFVKEKFSPRLLIDAVEQVYNDVVATRQVA